MIRRAGRWCNSSLWALTCRSISEGCCYSFVVVLRYANFIFFCFSVLLQLFFLPPQLNPFAVCTLSVWMSVKLLPVYQTLVTNTVANTARLPVQKRSCMCVSSFVKSCTFSSALRVLLCGGTRVFSHETKWSKRHLLAACQSLFLQLRSSDLPPPTLAST